MEVKIIKGTNQIGGCITEITSKGKKIIIDFGTDLDGEKTDFELDGFTKGKSSYEAVFITHSHGDHIGLVNKINKDIKVYIEEKSVAIHNIICDFKKDYEVKIRTWEKIENIKPFTFKEPIFIADDFKVTPFIVDHSAYNSAMFLIEAEGQKILHTGDFRAHGRKGKILFKTLQEIGKVDLLITEGTSLGRSEEKSETEDELTESIKKTIKDFDQVYVLMSSTNIDRLTTFFKAKGDKLFIQDLCMAAISAELPNIPNLTYKKTKVYIPKCYRDKKEPYNRYRNVLKNESNIIEKIPFDKKFIISVKPSMLEDLTENKDKIKNACLIYSMWEGYINAERKDDKTKDFVDNLEKLGIKKISMHTSGHADIKTLKKLNEIVNPSATIIIHTKNSGKGKEIFKTAIDIKDNIPYKLS